MVINREFLKENLREIANKNDLLKTIEFYEFILVDIDHVRVWILHLSYPDHYSFTIGAEGIFQTLKILIIQGNFLRESKSYIYIPLRSSQFHGGEVILIIQGNFPNP